MATLTAESAPIASRQRLLWLGVIIALIVGLPFLAKPFHIDDTVVLAIARNVTHDPLRPFAGSINWFGDPRPIFEETTNPPLVSYYLAPVVARFGFAEVPLHVAMLLFLLILALATAALSRRFAHASAWPVLFVMLSPAVVVSNNVMRDVPLAALSAAAAALFVIGVDRRSWPLAVAGSLVAGMALLTKYSGAALLPVLALYAILQRRGRYAFSLAAALALLGLWSLDTQLVHGRVHLAYLMAERRGDLEWSDRFYSGLVVIGACLFLLPALVVHVVRRRRFWLLGGAAAAAGLVFVGARMHYQGPVGWQYGLWLTTGAALTFVVIVPALASAPRGVSRGRPDAADTLFLALWAGGILLFTVFFVMFQAVRHIIPAIVPLAILGTRLLVQDEGSRWRHALLGVLLAAQAVVAFAVGAADYEYAATYRDFARQARDRLIGPGREVWFAGNWGWQRYALSAGFTLIAEHGRLPRPGDLVIIPDRVHKGPLPQGLNLIEIEHKTYQGRVPIHTMDGSVGVSFYATSGDSVPYAFTRERALETLRVFRVASIATLRSAYSAEAASAAKAGSEAPSLRSTSQRPRS